MSVIHRKTQDPQSLIPLTFGNIFTQHRLYLRQNRQSPQAIKMGIEKMEKDSAAIKKLQSAAAKKVIMSAIKTKISGAQNNALSKADPAIDKIY